MLLETCVGDAYGSEFEFIESHYVKKYNKGLKYHPSKGIYTDDTQQSLAIAEALLEDDEWTPLSLANRFVDVFKRDTRSGYSKRFFRLLTSVSNGKEFLKKIEPTRDSCGCVMRSVPLGLIKNEDELLEKARIQTVITHNHKTAIKSVQAIALVANGFIYNHNKIINKYDGKWSNYLTEKIPEISWKKWEGKVLNKAENVVRAVVEVLDNSNSFTDILINSCSFTGDTDSVASVAMGCYSLNFLKSFKNESFSSDLLILENKQFGGDYLVNLDEKLENKFNVKITRLVSFLNYTKEK